MGRGWSRAALGRALLAAPCPFKTVVAAPGTVTGITARWRGVQLHGQADALALATSTSSTFTLTMSPVLTTSRASLTNLLAKLAHMDQARPGERPESTNAPNCGHVAHSAFQRHALFQVFDVFHAVVARRATLKSGRGSRPGFSSSPRMSLHGDGRPNLSLDKQLGLERFDAHPSLPMISCHRAWRFWSMMLLDHRIGFGVHAGHVERVVAAANAQKARALLEGLRRPRPVTLSKCLTAFEHAIAHRASARPTWPRCWTNLTRVTKVARWRCSGPHPPSSRSLPPPRPAFWASSLWFTSCWYWPTPMALGSILTSSDSGSCRRRAMDGRAAQADVHIGHFLAGEFAGASTPKRPPSLTTTFCTISTPSRARRASWLDQVPRQLVGLAAGGAVANGDQSSRCASRRAWPGCEQRAFPVFARLVGVHRGWWSTSLPVAINHSDFHAGADAWVQPHDNARACGRGQQQVAQVVG